MVTIGKQHQTETKSDRRKKHTVHMLSESYMALHSVHCFEQQDHSKQKTETYTLPQL